MLASTILTLGAGLFVWYAPCPRFDFPQPTPFSGPALFNPYATGTAAGDRWLKVSLHAHSRAWGGLTNGRTSARETMARYRAMGFDVAALSNYQQVGQQELSVYEQGYNVTKSHLLVVGARRVDWLDYPLVQGPDEKQNRIDRLTRDGAVVIIAHPELRLGFTTNDLRQITGYGAIEVVSHFGVAERQWDTALSAGRLAWAVGDDDSHDSGDPEQTGRCWTMIAARSTHAGDVLDALRAGRTYAVKSLFGGGRQDVFLRDLTVNGDTITVTTSGRRATFRFVGRDGRLLAMLRDVNSARYVLPANEPYARVVVRTTATRLYLNPIVRTSGRTPQMLSARPAAARTSFAAFVAPRRWFVASR